MSKLTDRHPAALAAGVAAVTRTARTADGEVAADVVGTPPHDKPKEVIDMSKRFFTRPGLAGAATIVAASFMGVQPASAASTRAFIDGDTLRIQSSGHDDQLALRLAPGSTSMLQVDFNDDGAADEHFDRTAFSSIVVMLSGGDDQFRIDQANGAFADEAITVDGGGGNDTMNGGDGVETFLGRGGSDLVDGNRGADTAVLEGGNDTFRWDPGDGSDVVEGGGGFDTMDFNGATGAENMSLSPNGSRSLFFRDAGNIRMDMNDVELLDLAALGGIDTFTLIDMRGTGFVRADVDLGVGGASDGAADTVTVKGTQQGDEVDVTAPSGRVAAAGLVTELRISGSSTADHLQIDTLGGDDTVDVDAAVAALIDVAVDLGTDEA